jgi:predicted AAA+ superfamily ATPase
MNEKFEQSAGSVLSNSSAALKRCCRNRCLSPTGRRPSPFAIGKRSAGRSSLEPVRHIGAMRLGDLKEIDAQKEKIQRNTLQFVRGDLANNVC